MSTQKFSVSVRAGSRTLVAIDHYTYEPDQITFLFGESGIGKSIISKAIYGLLDPKGLEVQINGKLYADYLNSAWVKSLQKNSFFVFQEPSTHLNPLQKISDQLREGSLAQCPTEDKILAQLWQTASPQSVSKILDVFPKPYRPSGGEKQRVLLAMAFKKIDLAVRSAASGQPTFFVFDEPTGSLDNRYRNVFLEMLLHKYQEHPFTIQIITHDYSIISELYQHYKQLLDHIRLMELTRKEDTTLELHPFSAGQYLDWLAGAKPIVPSTDQPEPVLRVHPHFTVFGRSLYVSRKVKNGPPEDLVIRRGEMVYLKAASGVGKTTLAKIIMGIYRADQVSLELAGESITERTSPAVWAKKIWGKKASMVFQHADESLNLAASVRDVFTGLPLPTPLTDEMLEEKLSALFTRNVGRDFLNKKVGYLSGGQKQSLNLLRTFIIQPDLIILDEPLNGLDFNRIQRVLGLITEGCRQGSAILIITHNEEIMDHLVAPDRVWHLAQAEKQGSD